METKKTVKIVVYSILGIAAVSGTIWLAMPYFKKEVKKEEAKHEPETKAELPEDKGFQQGNQPM